MAVSSRAAKGVASTSTSAASAASASAASAATAPSAASVGVPGVASAASGTSGTSNGEAVYHFKPPDAVDVSISTSAPASASGSTSARSSSASAVTAPAVPTAPASSTPASVPASAPDISSSYGSTISLTEPRPSPWHAIADSLQTTPSLTPAPSSLTSSALREWERQLAEADAVRHLLYPQPLGRGSPKLSAERDRDGHVEYKLKLIDPEPERFDRLVTQMMWRLKQGRNEAIYEIGLGDDGSVIGLTRAEMDASLSTLERMASEVGATVLVLKEIVLTEFSDSESVASSQSGWSGSAGGSATGSVGTAGSGGVAGVGSGSWKARRPDLDEFGRPRRGTKSLDAQPLPKDKKKYTAGKYPGSGGGVKKNGDKRRRAALRQERRRAELMRGDGMSPTPWDSFFDESVVGEREALDRGVNGAAAAAADGHGAVNGHDVVSNGAVGGQSELSGVAPVNEHAATEGGSVEYPAVNGHISIDTDNHAEATLGQNGSLSGLHANGHTHSGSHTPSLPSHSRHSLNSSTPDLGESTPDDTFVDGLRIPLDSLSLSFADVIEDQPGSPRSIRARSPLQCVARGEGVGVEGGGDGECVGEAGEVEELVCVEALVVRKAGLEGEYFLPEDGWGFGE